MIKKILGVVKEPLRRIGQIGLKVAKFGLANHQYITPLLHSVAMASGNTKAQQITGGLLSLSQMASMRQNINKSNAKIDSAMRANGGKAGVFDHSTGKLT